MKKNICIYIFTCLVSLGFCQKNIEKLPPDNIKTVIFKSPLEENQIPIVKLGNLIELKFDDINGDEADYYYKIQHFNFDWTKSQLMKSEYLQGLDDQHIQEYENSLTTLQLYSHYTLRIPNRDVRIKKTGNYLLKIYDDEDELVFSKRFIVYKDQTTILPQIKRARDLNFVDNTQVVQFTIRTADAPLINPKKNVKTLVFQNNNIDNAIYDLKPQYTMGNDLIYRYDEEARFWAGNEYFFYDNKEIRGSNISINYFELGNLYHNYLFTNESRANTSYTFNPDINGDFVVRNLNANNQNIEADYVLMHFKLENFEDLTNKRVFLYGGFTNYRIDDSTELQFNKESGLYEITYLVKQGFVNYKFVTVNEYNEISSALTGGDFYQTENNYSILVYYRPIGGRFDEVIGYAKASSINISN